MNTDPAASDGAAESAGRGGARAGRPETAQRLLLAAIESFGEHGYHGTSTRAVAARAGMSPAAMYMYFPTKEDLLYQISRTGHELTIEVVERAADGLTDPVERVHAIVSALVGWHAEQSTIARIVQYELTSLTPGHRREILRLRRRTEAILQAAVDEGVAMGRFQAALLPTATLAITSLAIDVARWYPAQRRRRPARIAADYADLALRMLGATPPTVLRPESPETTPTPPPAVRPDPPGAAPSVVRPDS